MIRYETDPSQYFIANKAYCETLEAKLDGLNYTYSGFCNSFGYLVESTFKKNNLICTLKFIKEQTTRGGEILPVNAADYAGIDLTIDGFPKPGKIDFGNNKMKRLMSSREFKVLVRAPFYFSANLSSDISKYKKLIAVLELHKVDSFKLDNGKIRIKIHSGSTDMFELISQIEKLMVSLA